MKPEKTYYRIQKPEMTEEGAKKHRDLLIREGLLKLSDEDLDFEERPCLTPRLVQNYKNRLIKHGILKPKLKPKAT